MAGWLGCGGAGADGLASDVGDTDELGLEVGTAV